MKGRKLGITLALICGLGTTTALFWTLGSSVPVRAAADVRYVRIGGIDSGNCPLASPCASVQYAVDVANDGDAIYVAEGTYSGVQFTGSYTQMVELTKTAVIRGGFSSDFSIWDPALYTTTLDAQRQGRVFAVYGDIEPAIEGFWMINGDAEAGSGSGAAWGGALLAVGGSGPSMTITLRHNHVIGNHASSGTGSGHGGGLSFIFANVVLEDNEIAYNETDGSGGGLRMEQANGELQDNVLRDNSAVSGGGIYLNFASVQMTNTVIADNVVSFGGAGMVAGGAYATMLHTTLARNSGGDGSGVYVTIGGIHYPGTVVMTNTIAVSHTVAISVRVGHPWYGDNQAHLYGVLWYGNGQNVGGDMANIHVIDAYTGTPDFGPDGYHLGPSSAAIDRGLDAGVEADIDGQTRPIGTAPDLGADEVPLRVFLPVLMKTG